jgi:hypothetical protein
MVFSDAANPKNKNIKNQLVTKRKYSSFKLSSFFCNRDEKHIDI